MGEPCSEFSKRSQMFRTRHLGAVLPFHLFSALAQLLDHVVEATTEVTDFVVAIGKAYGDIEVTFSNAHNLVLKFQRNRSQIVAAFSCG
jgi:hypothetical protein